MSAPTPSNTHTYTLLREPAPAPYFHPLFLIFQIPPSWGGNQNLLAPTLKRGERGSELCYIQSLKEKPTSHLIFWLWIFLEAVSMKKWPCTTHFTLWFFNERYSFERYFFHNWAWLNMFMMWWIYCITNTEHTMYTIHICDT